MNVRNCRKCGRIYNYVVGPNICPSCREKMEAKFSEVKEFVRENKGANIPEISEHCDIETSQIQQWIREERLVFAEDSPLGIECEGCGTMIKTGRYCDKCKAALTQGFNPTSKKEKSQRKTDPRENPKMRFL
ncbi:MAG: flagellar protein [Lachnospiraceae bacterium]|nr:flagellar protein [Lachnospiraceae bacterium]